MRAGKWSKIRVIEEFTKEAEELKVGDIFLYGSKMIDQKESKRVGEQITFWKVTRKENKNITYVPVMEFLEEG